MSNVTYIEDFLEAKHAAMVEKCIQNMYRTAYLLWPEDPEELSIIGTSFIEQVDPTPEK